MRRTPFYFSLAATLPGLAACAADRGPTAPPSLDALSGLIADEPVSHLVVLNALTYSAAAGGFTARLGVSQGLLTAARAGQADFRVQVQLTVSNYLEQDTAVSPKTDPLAALKTVADFGTFELVDMAVPWNGLDTTGKPVTGLVVIAYRITLQAVPGGTVDPLQIGGGALTGSTELVIE